MSRTPRLTISNASRDALSRLHPSGFGHVPFALLHHPDAKPNHRALYAAIAASVDFQSFEGAPRRAKLMSRAGFTSPNQFYAARTDLIDWGFVEVEQRDGRSSRYRLLPTDERTELPDSSATDDEEEVADSDRSLPPGSDSESGGATDVIQAPRTDFVSAPDMDSIAIDQSIQNQPRSLQKAGALGVHQPTTHPTASASSLRSDASSVGVEPDIEKQRTEKRRPPWNQFVGKIKPLIVDRLWQGSDPPSNAPRDWDLSRDLSVLKGWLEQGYRPQELIGGIDLYEGPPCTTAAWQKSGNRGELNRLIAKYQKQQDTTTKIGDLIRANDG